MFAATAAAAAAASTSAEPLRPNAGRKMDTELVYLDKGFRGPLPGKAAKVLTKAPAKAPAKAAPPSKQERSVRVNLQSVEEQPFSYFRESCSYCAAVLDYIKENKTKSAAAAVVGAMWLVLLYFTLLERPSTPYFYFMYFPVLVATMLLFYEQYEESKKKTRESENRARRALYRLNAGLDRPRTGPGMPLVFTDEDAFYKPHASLLASANASANASAAPSDDSPDGRPVSEDPGEHPRGQDDGPPEEDQDDDGNNWSPESPDLLAGRTIVFYYKAGAFGNA